MAEGAVLLSRRGLAAVAALCLPGIARAQAAGDPIRAAHAAVELGKAVP